MRSAVPLMAPDERSAGGPGTAGRRRAPDGGAAAGGETHLIREPASRSDRADHHAAGALPGEAVWIAGAPHVVRLPGGRAEHFHLAEYVLVWRSGGRTYRLESALGRDASTSVAAGVTDGP